MSSSQEVCAICLESSRAQPGQALFTAECSHTFHFNCISSSVQHGNHICPTCRNQWTNLPSQFTPASNAVPPPPPPIAPRFHSPYYSQLLPQTEETLSPIFSSQFNPASNAAPPPPPPPLPNAPRFRNPLVQYSPCYSQLLPQTEETLSPIVSSQFTPTSNAAPPPPPPPPPIAPRFRNPPVQYSPYYSQLLPQTEETLSRIISSRFTPASNAAPPPPPPPPIAPRFRNPPVQYSPYYTQLLPQTEETLSPIISSRFTPASNAAPPPPPPIAPRFRNPPVQYSPYYSQLLPQTEETLSPIVSSQFTPTPNAAPPRPPPLPIAPRFRNPPVQYSPYYSQLLPQTEETLSPIVSSQFTPASNAAPPPPPPPPPIAPRFRNPPVQYSPYYSQLLPLTLETLSPIVSSRFTPASNPATPPPPTPPAPPIAPRFRNPPVQYSPYYSQLLPQTEETLRPIVSSQFTPASNAAPPPPPPPIARRPPPPIAPRFNNPPVPYFHHYSQLLPQNEETFSLIFSDDEPFPSADPNTPSTSPTQTRQVETHQTREMTVTALPECPAMSRSEQSDSVSVLVGIRAPPLSPEASDRPDARAPIDLVAVLDVSGSMIGNKIRLLKQAMGFVVDNLGPADRLSVITFSTMARRVTPLRIMADTGRADTVLAVNSLQADGYTNIIAGLKMAVQVLEQRRQKNPVASIILLSDGQDTQNGYGSAPFLQCLRNLPPCIRANATDQASATLTDVVPVPVHTFGFGSDHDATALHAIAEGSGGTFSYIESIEIIQDAFARCIGGLLSVVAQEVEIHVQSGVPGGVQIRSISSGRYRNSIDNDANQHQSGRVHVGDVYAEEEKKFLVNLSVPLETTTSTTKLLEVKCSYKDPISNQSIMTETIIVEIRRPATENLSEADRQVCIEVDRERNRISIAEGIAQAQTMADRGEFVGARALLCLRRTIMIESSSAQAGDRFSSLLEDEMKEIEELMTNRAEYETRGKAYACSRRSSHDYQRASTQAVVGRFRSGPATHVRRTSGSSFSAPHVDSDSGDAVTNEVGYQTSFMLKMVQKSQDLRKAGNQDDQSGGSGNSN